MRLPLDWRNEAAWAYLRGFIAATPEEAKLSKGSNTPRLHVKKLDSLWKTLQMWYKIAEAPEFSMDLVEGLNSVMLGSDIEEVARMRYEGLKNNRHLYATLIDFAIGFDEKDLAQKLVKKVLEFDKMRSKYWQWKQRQIDEYFK